MNRTIKTLAATIMLATLSGVADAQRSNVNVDSGSGDGRYRGQTSAHVWADPNPTGMVFDHWSGDTSLLQNPRESHTKLRIAKLNVSVTANYRSAPAWTPTLETINMIQMGYYFPSSPVGVIFHFHGQGGSASLFYSNLERRIFANEAVAEGYAVVSIDSADRVNRDWNTSNDLATSPDIQNVQAAIDRFISLGLMTANTPKFAHGFSKGAGFSPRVARALNFRATSMSCLAGTPDIINITTIPTIWTMAQLDGTIMAGGVAQSRANHQNLLNRSIPTQWHLAVPSPVYPERFWRITGLTAADSQAIYNSLKQTGFLDGRNFLLADPDASGWQAVIPTQYSSFTAAISDQLRICWTEHTFFSDYNRRVLDFFNTYR
ncbi:MAG TPA: hypothetical protein PKA82_05620 [Pyrinomonadaceae bacterium]|nr:hypothetical protein [Pyrinomonadaceae bacterium]